MNEENMTIEEFRKYCEKNDDNIVKSFDKSKFKLSCVKCHSENVTIVNTLEIGIEGGCPTCGSWLEKEGAIILKCCDCGNSITILDSGDIDGC